MMGRNVEYVGPIVVGSGVAGLSTALGLGTCTLVTAGDLGEGGSTPLAQGGIAAVIDPNDRIERHAADTIRVAGGLADANIVDLVIAGGPAAIDELVRLQAGFDRDDEGRLTLGREAGHSDRRIVHANGDATGAAVAVALTRAVAATPAIDVRQHTIVVDLVMHEGDVVGVLTRSNGVEQILLSPSVVLATGGYAHCYARTTTPRGAIGSGVALAARVGAELADMEFVQFHPTALNVAGDDRLPLLTEALRGEGAELHNAHGQRFMQGEHPDLELAPRDIVARANYRQFMDGNTPTLDSRMVLGDDFPARFPTVFGLAQEHGFDPRTEALPVTPAAHFCMGGVAVDETGRASLPGLWAVGEASSTGLHGANRLASNSLLEGLVLGRRVAAAILADPANIERLRPLDEVAVPGCLIPLAVGAPDIQAGNVIAELREILWSKVGVVRDEATLRSALGDLERLADHAQADLTSRTIHTVATLVAQSALARTESRGAHYRSDYANLDPAQAHRSVRKTRSTTLQQVLVRELVTT